MWPFAKKEEQNTAVALKEQNTAVALQEESVVMKQEEPEEVEIPPYGTQVAGLTRFGESWIRLEDVSAIDFEPSDGCGAEYVLKSGETWHMSEEDAAALRKYLEGFEQIQKAVDSVT